MLNIVNFLINSSNAWLPITIFFVVLVFAFITGFINGLKTSIYFFSWNIVGFFVAIIIFFFGIDNIIEFIKGTTSSDNFLRLILINKTWISILFMIFILISSNLLAFIVYLFVRRFLKKTRGKRRKNPKRFFWLKRLSSGTIALVSSLPLSIFSTVIFSSSLHKMPVMFNFFDKLSSSFTLTKYKSPVQDFYSLMSFYNTLNYKYDKDDESSTEYLLFYIMAGGVNWITNEKKQNAIIDKRNDLKIFFNSQFFTTKNHHDFVDFISFLLNKQDKTGFRNNVDFNQIISASPQPIFNVNNKENDPYPLANIFANEDQKNNFIYNLAYYFSKNFLSNQQQGIENVRLYLEEIHFLKP